MKESVFYILLVILLGCCQDDDTDLMPKEIDCQDIDCVIEDEFYASGLLNSECWTTNTLAINPLSESDLIIAIGDREINGIRSELNLSFEKAKTNLEDTIWLSRQTGGSVPSNSGTAQYIYWEDHTPVGRFNLSANVPYIPTDYLLIDYYNADTSILEGRFQLKFTERDVSSFVTHAPDSMEIKCGSFKIEDF
jgi:hypothetical protein